MELVTKKNSLTVSIFTYESISEEECMRLHTRVMVIHNFEIRAIDKHNVFGGLVHEIRREKESTKLDNQFTILL